jgi:hypothetical protein
MNVKKEKLIYIKTEKNVQASVPVMDHNLMGECMKIADRISQLHNLSSAAESFTSKNQQDAADTLQISTKKS